MVTLFKALFEFSKIVEKQFACSLSFLRADRVDILPGEKRELMETAIRNPTASRIYSGRDVLIPVHRLDDLVYVGVLENGFSISSEAVEGIVETINKIVSSFLAGDSWEKYVTQYEDGFSESGTSNVIYLTKVKKGRMIPSKDNKKKSGEFGGPVFVQTAKPENVQKIAVDFFREQKSLGLVPFSALDFSVLNTAETLHKLGRITIFIDDISSLSGEQQALVENYLGSPKSDDSPQLIIGATKTLDSMLNAREVSEGLARILQTVF